MLLHEIGHGNEFLSDPDAFIQGSNIQAKGDQADYDNYEERRVTNTVERQAAIKLGEVERDNHRGALIKVSNPTFHSKHQ